jgi:hypothetical protein
MWNVVLYLTLLVIVASYALWRGGAPERIITMILLVAVVASGTIISQRELAFSTRETTILIIDVLLLVAVVTVALFADRYWPIWMAAFLGIGLELQFAMWAAPQVHVWLYRILHSWNSYPTLLLLFLGTLRHRQRLARLGADPSWSGSWNRWSLPMRKQSPPG